MGELMRMDAIDRTTEIAIPTSEGAISMSVASVLRWIAKDAPETEAIKFLMVCRAAKVNPFLGEAHLVNHGGRFTTIIDKSGWLRQAEDNPDFEGFEAGVILRKILGKTKGPDGKEVIEYGPLEDHEGAVQPSGYQLVGGWAKVYRRGRSRPIVSKVALNEYRKNSPIWDAMPCSMIRKCALVSALREAKFLVGGAYDRDEIRDIDDAAFSAKPVAAHQPATAMPAEVREAIDVEFRAVPTHQLDQGLAAELEAAIQAAGMSDYQRDVMLSKRGVRSIAELGHHDAREILAKLYQVSDQQRAGQILLPDPAPADGEVIDVSYVVDGEVVDAEATAAPTA